MVLGILGRKVGMTQIFSPEGLAIPVTVVQAGPCTVTQIKTQATDGYNALQVGYLPTAEKHLTQPQRGHLNKAGVSQMLRHLREFRVEQPERYQLGQSLTVEMFTPGQLLDVAGTSIGRGFAGNQKRHHFGRGPMSHGSKNHREPGSIGAGTTPGRVFPGLRMAGRLGATRVTTRKLQLVQVDVERDLLLIKGCVPGVEGGLLEITPAKQVGNKR
ncbi:50S ribosomal protein L3 [Thermostichus vulcanus]|uniref:Large ribosomal subunit protein uL3 n=1 Tax=Thermostichus vulcanus str. 'Rupite' TaxID=2813851 RepID=A0ABT0CAJ5_THEVL|nr:50S ribosomal protein L3 [Thermostichus vulcanus str. 'Rupite']